MKPDYKISINGNDKTELFSRKLISINLRDVRGFDADQLDIELDDSNGDLPFYPDDAQIKVAIGYRGALIDKGTFTIDELSHGGPPDVLSIVARSGNINSLKTQKIRVWENISIYDMIKTIAVTHGFKHGVSNSFASKIIEQDSQTNESDMHFLTRMAKLYDAIACVKNNVLLFLKKGSRQTVSGITLDTIAIDRNDIDTHQYNASERTGKYTGVKARWYDDNAAKNKTELAGKEGTVKTLRRIYSNKNEAAQAADAEFNRISRSAASLNIKLSIGNAAIIPESPISLSGFKTEINQQNWITKQVDHQLTEQGLITTLQLEAEQV